jgi:hypothetical protein
MTAVGWHVHEVTAPTIELVVDRVATLPDGHEVLRAVDSEHGVHYVAAADTELHARHRRGDDVVLPSLPGTERGVLADPRMGLPWFGGAQ